MLVTLVGNTDNISNTEDPQAVLPFDYVERSLRDTVARILAMANGSHDAKAAPRTLVMAG
jgi:hypothetical protein